jgi:hypothetical protein
MDSDPRMALRHFGQQMQKQAEGERGDRNCVGFLSLVDDLNADGGSSKICSLLL